MRRAAPAVVALLAAGAAAAGGCGDRAPAAVTPLAVTVAGDGLVPERATGVAVGRGRVLTVAHVLAAGASIRVGGRPARVLRADRRLDAAVLAVPGVRGPALALGGTAVDGRIRVLRDGRPRWLPVHVRRRVTAHVRLTGAGRALVRPALELAAAVEPGDSGAPVVDAHGRALGVVFARSSARARTAWAVDAGALRRLLAR